MQEYLNRWGTALPLQGPFLVCCYFVLAGMLVRAAWKNRTQGWAVGLLFGFMLVSLPVWVMGLFYFTQWLGIF